MSIKSLVLCFGVTALYLQSVHCFDEDTVVGKLHELYEPSLAECGPKFGVTKEQLKAVQEKKVPSSVDGCFMACMFKHHNIINDKGMFDKDAAIAEATKNFSGDFASAVLPIMEKCNSVNDASVSDGDAGCDRAKLLSECFRQNKDLIKN